MYPKTITIFKQTLLTVNNDYKNAELETCEVYNSKAVTYQWLHAAACGARSSPKNLVRSSAARPAMGIHVCNGALVLLLAALLSPAAGKILSHRFDLGRWA